MADAARELALSFIKGVLAQRIMMQDLVAATQAPPESIGRAAEGGRDREARRLQAELQRPTQTLALALALTWSER